MPSLLLSMHLSTVLNTNVNEPPYIIEINSGTKVCMKEFNIIDPEDTNCDDIMELVFLEVQFLI